MDFSQLSMFLTLVECRQFSEAAERESISQSSFSKQIKALEDELGAKLFKRTVKGAELTGVGKEFLSFAQTASNAKNNMHSRIALHIDTQNKTTTVGVMPVMTSYDIAELLADFHEEFPEYSINIIEKNTREIAQLLADSSLYMALLGTKMVDLDKYDEYTLAKDPIVLAVSMKHPLAKNSEIGLESLKGESFIRLEDSIGLNKIIMEGCKKAGFVPNVSYSCSTVPSALSMVKEGLGVLLLTTKGINVFNTSGIKQIKLLDELYGKLVLVTSKEYELNQADIAFRNFTLEWYKFTFKK